MKIVCTFVQGRVYSSRMLTMAKNKKKKKSEIVTKSYALLNKKYTKERKKKIICLQL